MHFFLPLALRSLASRSSILVQTTEESQYSGLSSVFCLLTPTGRQLKRHSASFSGLHCLRSSQEPPVLNRPTPAAPSQQHYMRSFERPSGPSRPAAPVTCVTKHRIMRDNVLHPHFQSSRFNPSFRWQSSLVRTFFRPHRRNQRISQAHAKPPAQRLSARQGRSWFARRCFPQSSATRTILPAPCTYPTKERSRAPTHCITGPFVVPLPDSEKREKTPNTAQYHE